MRGLKNNDRGQSGTIVAILLVPIMAILALAIDVAAMHVDKQQLQTGADAGVLAVAHDCARDECPAEHDKTTAQAMADHNFKGNGATVDSVDIDTEEQTVRVVTSTVREHWFAPIIGINSSPITVAASAAWSVSASTQAGTFFPLALSECLLRDFQPEGSEVTVDLKASDCTQNNGSRVSGGFGWLKTTGGQCTDYVFHDDGRVKSDTGNNAPCGGDFDDHLNTTIFMPVYADDGGATGNGANAGYFVSKYAAFTLTGYNFDSNNQIVTGTWQRSLSPAEIADSVSGTPGDGTVRVNLFKEDF